MVRFDEPYIRSLARFCYDLDRNAPLLIYTSNYVVPNVESACRVPFGSSLRSLQNSGDPYNDPLSCIWYERFDDFTIVRETIRDVQVSLRMLSPIAELMV